MTEDTLKLKPLSTQESQTFLDLIYDDYTQSMLEAKAGYPDASVKQYSKESIDEALPKGIETKDNYFYGLFSEECHARIWFAIEQDCGIDIAFLYYIHVDEKYRRQGLASEVLKQFEAMMKSKFKAEKICLSVFGGNHAAQALYKKLGFETYTERMIKSVI